MVWLGVWPKFKELHAVGPLSIPHTIARLTPQPYRKEPQAAPAGLVPAHSDLEAVRKSPVQGR